MSDRCLNLTELDGLADLAAGDPRLAHVENCPRCRALARSQAAFLDPANIPPEADLEDAEARLTAALAEEMGGPVPVVRPPTSFWTPFRVRTLAAAAAVVIVAVGLSLVDIGPQAPPAEPVLRNSGASSAPWRCRLDMLEAGDLRLSWPTVAAATDYRVIVFSIDLEELATFAAGPVTSFTVIPPPGAAFCRVVALRAGDEIRRSDPVYFDDN
jgi:hypothetical protein